MESTVIFTYFCIAMTQLWLATSSTNEKFKQLMYYLWFFGAILGFSTVIFK